METLAVPDFSPEDRALLDRFVPRLQYDAQDAYRATSAATMTDYRENLLVGAVGDRIAGTPDLRLDTLAAYPGGRLFAAGDHLAGFGDPVAVARELQAKPEYPHCAYGRVLPGTADEKWLQYWLWYHDNPKTFLGKGGHQGDWELVQVHLVGGEVKELTFSQHGLGETLAWDKVPRDPDDEGRPLVYVAPFSHANYSKPETRFYFPAADHPTDRGPCWVPVVRPFGDWQNWLGRWGSNVGMLGGRFRALGGVSPDAPAKQTLRWCQPADYCNKATRPATSWFKSAIWWIGKATFPAAPEIVGVELRGQEVVVRYRRVRRGLLGGTRRILFTAHGYDSPHHMLHSVVVRARGRGETVLPLPGQVDRVRVWASSFNGLGQRSEPVGPVDFP